MRNTLIKRSIITPKRFHTIKLPHQINQDPVKPRLSQFSHALYNTLMISLSTFFLFNIVYNNLQYQEIEQELKLKSTTLENQIQTIVDEKDKQLQQEQESSNKRWIHKLKCW